MPEEFPYIPEESDYLPEKHCYIPEECVYMQRSAVIRRNDFLEFSGPQGLPATPNDQNLYCNRSAMINVIFISKAVGRQY